MSSFIFALVFLAVGFGGGALLAAIDPGLTKARRWLRLAGALAAGAVVVASPITVVPAGHVGVIRLFGKVRPAPIHEGIHVVNPLADVEAMSVQVQRIAGKYSSASQDMQTVHVNMIINIRLIPEQAPDVYRRVGVAYAETVVDPAVQETLKAVTARHKAVDILSARAAIKRDVADALRIWIARYGVVLQEVSLANIAFDPTYAAAIERKQVQEQLAEQKRYEVVRAQREAEMAVAAAKGVGDAAREQAQGTADALRVRGEAEAEYNRVVAASMRGQRDLVQVRWIEKWNGTLPTMVMGDAPGVLVSVPGGSR